MTLPEIATACESAGQERQKELLARAFKAMRPFPEPVPSIAKFGILLDADAYLDAAMMLLPEGYYPVIDFVLRRAWIRDAHGFDMHNGCAYGHASTSALSLLAAICRALGSDYEKGC